MFSSDDDAALPLEKWLKTKLSQNTVDAKNGCNIDEILHENPEQILTPKELKKLNEKEFEQNMEDALADLDDLDQINSSTSGNLESGSDAIQGSVPDRSTNECSKRVKFAENLDTIPIAVNEQHDADKNIETKNEKVPEIECEEGFEDFDPFYDPEADDEDEKWVQNERIKHLQKRSNNSMLGNAPKRATLSDAILSCPACMAIVCIDCQRHEFYPNQYRAMFVVNCKVSYDELLHLSPKAKRNKKRRGAKSAKVDEDGSSCNILAEGMKCTKKEINASNFFQLEADNFHPVKCEICTTEVAVYDKDEIYHFFNTIASLS